jgi:Dihydrodipicolinate synthetase family
VCRDLSVVRPHAYGGAGTNATASTVDALQSLASVPGVVAALVVVPYYTRPSAVGIVEHFRTAAPESPVPIVADNVPYRTGRGLEAPDLLEIASTTRVDGSFGLVYLVYNTITNRLTQAEQVACFRNAAAHLERGGNFVVEVFIPTLQRLPAGETIVPFDVSAGHIGLDEYDIVNQTLVSRHYYLSGARVDRFDTTHRYAWPAEYDLMAEIAGLTLSARWSNWNREPLTAQTRPTSRSGRSLRRRRVTSSAIS